MIKFHSIKWKNILSTGNNFTEIRLDKSQSTLIVGKNGSGKSTILDALTFALFGKPFRKINKPNLINSINNGDAVVEVLFSIGKKKYKVIRGIKPNIFEIYCDDVLVNQDAKSKDYQEHLENFILKLNYKSFTQVVILGSASFVPFMQLSASDRRSIIEDLLDIQIFSSMNSIVKNKLSELKDQQKQTKYDMDLLAEKILLQKQNIEENKKNNEEQIESLKNEINTHELQIEKYQKDNDLIQKHIDVLLKKISDKNKIETRIKKLSSIETKMETKLKSINKNIDFYQNNDECSTCKQIISSDFKHSQIQQNEIEKNKLQEAAIELSNDMETANLRINEIQNILKHIQEHNSELVRINASIVEMNKFIRRTNAQIQQLMDKKNNSDTENIKLKELNEQLKSSVSIAKELSETKQYYEFSANLLKDTGIKTKIIKQYLPIMNKLINKYLASMDFFVNFNLNENFEETIKSRHRDEFTYASFSEGEKQKIDLALLFTWRQIAKLKNSTNTNLLILDEVFDSSLDASSVDLLMNLLNEISEETNVFVISHKGDIMFDKFRSVIKFEKKNNFSQVVK
jgi:DNA repair exonuclease SbcCD ATPase subunit